MYSSECRGRVKTRMWNPGEEGIDGVVGDAVVSSRFMPSLAQSTVFDFILSVLALTAKVLSYIILMKCYYLEFMVHVLRCL